MRNFRFEPRVREYNFLYNEVLDYYKHYKELGVSEDDLSKDLIESMLDECAKYSSTVLFPLLQTGDREGCTLKNGNVTTPKGFKEAWNVFVESGWQGISSNKNYGGQGLPSSVSLAHRDMMATANWPFFMYPGLSAGAIATLNLHGTEHQKELYLRKIIEGTWTGTMCLTEPHCGTDLAQVKTKAEPSGDGKTYKITGTKIFISSGDHDLTENIVHIVLARLPDAPEGTKGISLFVVPRHLVKEDGSLEKEKNVICAGLEKKMGIHGNATAQLSFEGSTGYLVGAPHTGMKSMFTFMNAARLGTAVQGVAHTEIAFQNALWYTQERRVMRALEGTQDPDKVADPIISHGDVREKVLFCKAIADAGRAFTLDLAKLVDRVEAAEARGDEKAAKELEAELGFYTPIAKGCLTELGVEAASAAVQCYGGHGYIAGHGVEQNLRDARIATIYEGTTAVQALDFIARKVLLSKTNQVGRFFGKVKGVIQPRLFSGGVLGRSSRALFGALLRMSATQAVVGMTALKQKEMVGTAATDFLYAAGYIVLGYYHILMAAAAQKKIAANEDPQGFYQNKIDVCEFYFERIFPRYRFHLDIAAKSPSSVFTAKVEHLNFKN